MAELIEILNKISQENQNGMKPADVAFGTVISTEPLQIQTEGAKQPIPNAALILTSEVIAKTASVQGGGGGTVVINEGLNTGDRVIMMKVSKGQRYIVLSKTQ